MPVNWEAQRRMNEDVTENADLYAALAGTVDDSVDNNDGDKTLHEF
jgi:hypothetical protein